jgi:glycosyltransferase involved in cell wall biosynthesis
MEKPKWTIGIVNWKSIEFIEYQLKYFHSFSDDFEFLVCDNESDIETPKFKELKEKYPKLKLINRYWKSDSWAAHGIGLNQCTKIAEGKYILLMDPDFFWMKKDILSFFEHYFDQGYHAIGTEYWSHSFPMPWGAAYITDEIRDLDLRAKAHPCDRCHTWTSDHDHDTGFQIRIRLKNKPFFSFRSSKNNQIPDLGKLNNIYAQTFVYDGRNIAHHLKDGCKIKEGQNRNEINEIKNKYTEWMWSQLWE